MLVPTREVVGPSSCLTLLCNRNFLMEKYIMATPTSSNGLTAVPQARPRIGRPLPMDREVPSRPTIELGKVQAGSPSADSINSGMTVSNPVVITVKPVDRKTITGSTPGDHRAPNTGAGITDQFKTPPGPRDRVRQAELSSRTPSAAAPTITDSAAPVGD